MQIQGSMLRVANYDREKPVFGYFVGKNQDNETENRKTIFVGRNEKEQENPLVEKRKEAQKKASTVIKDAFEEELALDKKIEESHDRISNQKEQIKENLKQIQELEEQKEKMKGTCSEEEYEYYCAGAANMQGYLHKEIKEAQKIVDEENAKIKDIKKARQQSTNIQDAMNEADDIMEAARKEIIHDGVMQIKENMDEYMEEKKEQAEEKAEKREEKEELREEALERRDEHQPANSEKIATETLLTLDQLQSSKKQELDEILQEYSLIPEDIKGTSVDASL